MPIPTSYSPNNPPAIDLSSYKGTTSSWFKPNSGGYPSAPDVTKPAVTAPMTSNRTRVQWNGVKGWIDNEFLPSLNRHNNTVKTASQFTQQGHGDENLGKPGEGMDYLDMAKLDRGAELKNTYSLLDNFVKNNPGVKDTDVLGATGRDSIWGNRHNQPINVVSSDAGARVEPKMPALQNPLHPAPTRVAGIPTPVVSDNLPDTQGKVRKSIPLGDINGLGNYFRSRVKEVPPLQLDRISLAKPVVRQPDVNKPIAEMVAQAAGTIKQGMVNGYDPAQRVAAFGTIGEALNKGVADVHKNSADFTEQTRGERTAVINQERGMNNEIANTEKGNNNEWLRQRFNQTVGALQGANNQTAQSNAMRSYEGRNNNNRATEMQYQLDMNKFDDSIADLDEKMARTTDRAALLQLQKQREELNNRKYAWGQNYVNGLRRKAGGRIPSSYEFGGIVDYVITPKQAKEQKKELLHELKESKAMEKKKKADLSKEQKEVIRRNREYLRVAKELYHPEQTNLYGDRVPRVSVPRYKRA